MKSIRPSSAKALTQSAVEIIAGDLPRDHVPQERNVRMNVDAGLFLLMVEQVRDYAVFLINTEGRVMSWNTGAQLMKGYEANEVIGRNFSIFYTKDAIKRGWPSHVLRMAAVEGRFEDENYHVRKDGSRFWADVVTTALRDKAGKLVAFSEITRDMTARRAYEETLFSTAFARTLGFLMKKRGRYPLKLAAAGQSVLDPATTCAVADRVMGLIDSGVKERAVESLSSQEKRVLALVADGQINKEIAIALGLSRKTVKNYLSTIFKKLQVSRRTHAAVIYRQRNPEQGRSKIC